MSLPNNITQTPNIGLYQITTTSPASPDNNSDLAAAINFNAAALDSRTGVTLLETTSPASAIPVTQGVVGLGHAGGSTAYTLAAPVTGLPSAGGNDGQELTLINTSLTNVSTIATPANVINGNKSSISLAANGAAVVLRALGGFWYVVGSNGLTLV